MSILQRIADGFPDGDVPQEIVSLLGFQETIGGDYCGEFRVGVGTLLGPRFGIFGRDGDGSKYAYWFYGGRSLDTAPIVYFDTEGAGSGVIANTLRDFFWLLSIGVRSLGEVATYAIEGELTGIRYVVDRLEALPDSEVSSNTRAYRRWLWDTYALTYPDNPLMIVKSAVDSHPYFKHWLEDNGWGRQPGRDRSKAE